MCKEDSELYENQLSEILELCTSMKQKAEKVKENTLFLKRLNFKLEALLIAHETYTDENLVVKNEPKKVHQPISCDPVVPVKETIASIFIKDPKQVLSANEIYALLKEGSPVQLDAIVKHAKLTKYKTIEILNTLIKHGFITKKYDKGFIYTLVEQ